jgi:hypothetical protein
MTLTSYTPPALNAVDFALVTYTQPVYNTIDFELLDAPSSPIVVYPGVGQLVMTGFAPTVIISDHKIVYPGVGELVMTGYAPTVSISGPVEEILRGKISKVLYMGSSRGKPTPGKFGGTVKYGWSSKGYGPKKRK